MAYKINFLFGPLKPTCDGWLVALGIHILFKFQSFVIIFLNYFVVGCAPGFGDLEVSVLLGLEVHQLGGLPHFIIELVRVITKSLHFLF